MQAKKKIIRATTVPLSLRVFCEGMLKELSEKYDVVAVSSPDEDLDLVEKREGVRTIAVPMCRHISLFQDVKSLWQLRKVFKAEHPYMVHSMTPKAGLLCMMAAKWAGVPVRLHTFTGLVWPTAKGLKRSILKLTDKLTCACATHIVPEGQGVLNDLRAGGITRKPMKVLGYGNVRGVDMDFYSRENVEQKIDVDFGLANDKQPFVFLFVGRMVGDKGLNELVAAFKRVCGQSPEARLLLVGPYENELDPLAPETNEAIANMPNIKAVGPKFGKDLLPYYDMSDCFVFPSYREGFPNTVLEAGAMDLPCIVTDINGSREIIEEGKNGLIIPSKDTNALYEAMMKMVENDEMRKGMVANSRRMIAERYERGFVRRCLYQYYDEILG